MSVTRVNTAAPQLTGNVTATTGAPIVSYYTGDGTNGTNGTKYAVYEFTGSGSITLSASTAVDYLYIAGGGGSSYSGGGGAGGYLTGSTTLASGATTITVGAGGTGGASNTNGSNTVLGSLTTAVGGGKTATAGGSGGGAIASNPSNGGAGTAGQGYAGGNCTVNSTSAGGGGAGGAGPATALVSWNNEGGPPAFSYITGKYEQYGKGGWSIMYFATYTMPRINRGDGGHGNNSVSVTQATGSSGVVILRFIVT